MIGVFLERGIASVHTEAVQVLPFTEAVVVVDCYLVLVVLIVQVIPADIDLVLICCSRTGIAQLALAQEVKGTLGRGEIF